MTLGHVLVDAVLDDDRLGRTELRVFRVCWGLLNFEDFTAIKLDLLRLQLPLDRSQLSRALQNLCDFGYLEAGPRDDKGVGTYRLPRRAPEGLRQMQPFVKVAKIRRQLRDTL